MSKKPITVSWSGGKDSSYALWLLLSNKEYEVVELHTLVNIDTRRVGMHGVHESLISAQAESIGIPLQILYLNSSRTNDEFERTIGNYYSDLRKRNILHVGFGDIFLEDLKKYRERLLSEFDLSGIYPIWKKNTRELALDFIRNGFKTIICAASIEQFKSDITGLEFSERLLNCFDPTVDPCGENGEFHSYVFDGPIFSRTLPIEVGKKIVKTYEYKNSNNLTVKASVRFCELKLKS